MYGTVYYVFTRLGAAYDHFYQVLGFLSPKMQKLLQELQKSYTHSYRTNLFPEYAGVYASTERSQDIVEPYGKDDYPEAYAHFLTNQVPGGV